METNALSQHSGALQELEIRDAMWDVMEGGREALRCKGIIEFLKSLFKNN
ncbi:MAG: hypothetical protein ACLTIG_00945 [Roseburia hominis]